MPPLLVHERAQRRQLVSTILLIVAGLQLVDLPGALINHSSVAFGVVVLGLVMCGVAMLFNRRGMVTASSILLIVVVDLGCILMLLTTPLLDSADLPIFAVLIVSELISVSLLPAISVFPVAFSNILFILADITFQPHTPALNHLLASGMAYDVFAQPMSLQVIVGVVMYIWVQRTLRAKEELHH
jgi:hypothetical protein